MLVIGQELQHNIMQLIEHLLYQSVHQDLHPLLQHEILEYLIQHNIVQLIMHLLYQLLHQHLHPHILFQL